MVYTNCRITSVTTHIHSNKVFNASPSLEFLYFTTAPSVGSEQYCRSNLTAVYPTQFPSKVTFGLNENIYLVHKIHKKKTKQVSIS